MRPLFPVGNVCAHSLDAGPAIYVFGAAGPAYGSYEVSVDGVSSTKSAYMASNASAPCLLYGADNLTYATHTLTLRNLGKQGADAGGNGFLFDFLRTTVQLAPAGCVLHSTFVCGLFTCF